MERRISSKAVDVVIILQSDSFGRTIIVGESQQLLLVSHKDEECKDAIVVSHDQSFSS